MVYKCSNLKQRNDFGVMRLHGIPSSPPHFVTLKSILTGSGYSKFDSKFSFFYSVDLWADPLILWIYSGDLSSDTRRNLGSSTGHFPLPLTHFNQTGNIHARLLKYLNYESRIIYVIQMQTDSFYIHTGEAVKKFPELFEVDESVY
jgi:hypothetical protein